MAIVLSDNFNTDTHVGGMTDWTDTPTGGIPTFGVVEEWGQLYTTCAGCSGQPGQATRLVTPVTTGQGSIRCRVAALLTDPPVDTLEGALTLNVQNYAGSVLFQDVYQLLVYLRADGSFRIRYKTGLLTTAFQATAASLFPVDGTWFGLQVRFTIAATNTVVFTVNNVDVATLTWSKTYDNANYDNPWLYAYGVLTGGGPPIQSMVLLDNYELDNSNAAVTWGAGSGPTLDPLRTCFYSPITPPTPPTPVTYPIRRLRRFMLPWDDANRQKFISRLELIMQTGIGTSTVTNPQVMLRLSKDGGLTWGSEILMAAGPMGEYSRRVFVNRLGRTRNAVVELSCSDPVDWQWVQFLADIDEGSS